MSSSTVIPSLTLPLPNPHSRHPIQRCSTISEINQLHANLIKTGLSHDPVAQDRLIASCIQIPSPKSIDYALSIFSNSSDPTPFMRNNIIKSFAEGKTPQKAVSFYSTTHENGFLPNHYTFPALLKACSRLLGIEEGKQIHTHVLKTGYESEVHVCNTLIHFYCSCGFVDNARKLFDRMSVREVVTWNSIITGYSLNGISVEALNLFREMQVAGLNPDQVTMISVLSACAHAGALELGKWVHAYINKNNLDLKISVRTALVDMYSKCGCIERALEVFEEIPNRNLVCWTAMINGLAINGLGRKAVEFFEEMVAAKFQPDAVLLITILSACSHGGLVEEGRQLFHDMRWRFGITPQMEHYGCMVDLLGRSGCLMEAYELIKNMPFAPNVVMWRTLLGACKVHKNVELGELVQKEILELEPGHHGDYILLSNIYASEGRWEDVAKVRRIMKKKKIPKIPGCSMIEVDNKIHSFIVEDKSHQHSEEIHRMLDEMTKKIKLAGYVPDTSKVLIDIDEEGKESALVHHSEKVAVAFGLIKTARGTPLRIVKNIRVCNDCHLAMKLVSEIYEREIIVRDRNRFHHFREGCCSCGDYW